MKSVKVPVLIDYATVPRRYRALLRKLQRGRWTRPESRWVRRQHLDLPPIVAAVIRQKGPNPTLTLLVNSKTCGEAGLQTIFESQRGRVYVSGDTHSHGSGD